MNGVINKTFIIEGNIGAGKSTLISELSKLPGVEVIPEPVSIWQNIKSDGISLLDYYYTDKRANSYLFQTMASITHAEVLDKEQIYPIRICERSFLSSKNIFFRLCKETGTMRDIETECYSHLLTWLTNKYEKKVDGIIYLRCSPETCKRRIENRGRVEEKDISLEYLSLIDSYHEEWLSGEDNLLVINNDEEGKDETNVVNINYQKILDKCREFMGIC